MRGTLLVLVFAGCGHRALGLDGEPAWPMVGHDAQHTSASAFEGPVSMPDIAFSFVTGDRGFVSDPVIDASGYVYVAIAAGNSAAQLYAIDPTKPNELNRWTVAPCGYPVVRPSIGPDGLVVACSGILDTSALVSVSLSGQMGWTSDVDRPDATAPMLAVDGTSYVGSTGIVAFSKDGDVLWLSGDDDVPAPPVLDGAGGLYFVDVSGQVHALATSSGAERWVTPIDSSPRITGCGLSMGRDEDLFACFPNGVLASLGTDGSVRWTHKLADDLPWPGAVDGSDTLYIVSIDDHGASSQASLRAFASDGTQKWSTLLAGTGGSTPSIDANGTIYVGDNESLTAFSRDGVQLWSTLLGGTATSTAIGRGGQLVVGSSDGTVHAYGP